jgi:hypothetical protein
MAPIRFRLFKFSGALSLKLALIAGFFTLVQTPQVLLAAGIPQRWETKEYQPPAGLGAPTRVDGGGTRGGSSCAIAGKPLTALVPGSRFGATVAAFPTFLVYMPALSPQTSPLPVEFVLEDTNGNQVYKSTFKTSGQSGIVTLTLPTQAGLSPLQVGQDYKWSFSLICQPDERSRDMTVEGWVRRVELNPTLKTQLRQASPQKQAELYAQAELWQDALATLAQLRRDKPSDSAVAADWAKLLSAAGLNDITQESLVLTPTTAGDQLSSSQP